MKLLLKILILLIVAFAWFWGAVAEPYLLLETERVDIKIPLWDKNLDGLKVVLISDIHAGQGPHENWRVNRIIERANSLNPDVILLLGDYVNGGVYYRKMSMKRLSAYFKRLKARYGVYAILGNHDSIYNVVKIRKMIADSGAKLIENSNAKISTPKGDFYIAGIADATMQDYSYKKTFAGIPKGASVIFLSHTPDVLREIPPAASVMFSGHTHGGQIRIPYLGEIVGNVSYEKEAVAGLLRKDGKTLYTTRGLGTSRIPIRLFCPPEITLATISKSDEVPINNK